MIVPSNERLETRDQSVEELQQIIHNQNKYIQQLQIRIRIHAPETIQTSRPDRLVEENQVRDSPKCTADLTSDLESSIDA